MVDLKTLENSKWLKQLYHAGRGLLRKTGRDVIRLDALDKLKSEAGAQVLKQDVLDKLNWEVGVLRNAIETQQRAAEAYRLEKSIIPLRADRYRYEKNVNNDELLVFKATGRDDFDWLERAILDFGYYEKPGVWSFVIDMDKKILAHIIASLKPRRTLDLGCANGPVVQALADLNVRSEGVEISRFALEHAFPGIKDRIHLGDILDLSLPEQAYDVISGFDLFEHLNPNKIDACLEKIFRLLAPKGLVFANIPAFGKDEIFGEVFPYYMSDWDRHRDGRSYFETLHVDMHGYPVNGHLIWADTKWWISLFERHGFVRRVDEERKLHAEWHGKQVRSRESFYLFQRPA